MRNLCRVVVALFLIATIGVALAARAQAEVAWSGPGWYVEAPSPPFSLVLGAGPYGDQQTCESEKAKLAYSVNDRNLTDVMFCGYLDSDPNK